MAGWPAGLRAVVVAVPALVLAGIGVTHPMVLDASTARHWWTLHVVTLPLFPLLAVVIWVMLRGEGGVIAWAARIAGFIYAVFYTELDTVVGISAGLALEQHTPDSVVDRLIVAGNELAYPALWAYPVAAVLTGFLSVRRDGSRALPGAVIFVAAAIAFRQGHIYWPVGVAAMIGTALGAAALELARRRPASLLAHPGLRVDELAG